MTDNNYDFDDYFIERDPYEEQFKTKQFNYFFTIERIIQHLGKNAMKCSILDVGCADGLLYGHLRDEKFTGTIDGVEISPKGRKEYYRRHPKDTVLFDSIHAIKGQYDVVTSTQTLEHQEKPEELLKLLYEKAKHLVIFTVPKGIKAIPSKSHKTDINYYKVCEMCESLGARDYHIYMINRDNKFGQSLNCLGVVIIK